MPEGFLAFEVDLISAVMGQLVPQLNEMDAAELSVENTSTLPDAQGIYLLIHDGIVKYVGKTDAEAGLRSRLTRHVRKFEQRNNIQANEVSYKAAQIFVLTAMDIETRVIKHFAADWNGSGFGSNDPGRNRELTDKPAVGFDAQFPVNIDLPVACFDDVHSTVHDALVALKSALPYTLRFGLEEGARGSHAFRTRPHPELRDVPLQLPNITPTVRQVMAQIVGALPNGWQATYFVSHVILYKENQNYQYGEIIPEV